jgi:hypothetical protein
MAEEGPLDVARAQRRAGGEGVARRHVVHDQLAAHPQQVDQRGVRHVVRAGAVGEQQVGRRMRRDQFPGIAGEHLTRPTLASSLPACAARMRPTPGRQHDGLAPSPASSRVRAKPTWRASALA